MVKVKKMSILLKTGIVNQVIMLFFCNYSMNSYEIQGVNV